MIHFIPYDGLGYAIHFWTGIFVYCLLNRWPMSRILITITILAAGKEVYDFLTDGAMDVWDFMFSIYGVIAARGSMTVYKDLNLI